MIHAAKSSDLIALRRVYLLMSPSLKVAVLLPNANGRDRRFRFRDIMVLDDHGDVRNEATLGWFGVRVGSVSLPISPGEGAAER